MSNCGFGERLSVYRVTVTNLLRPPRPIPKLRVQMYPIRSTALLSEPQHPTLRLLGFLLLPLSLLAVWTFPTGFGSEGCWDRSGSSGIISVPHQ